jgi:CP family cyanate transporter-like MFS transporter
MLRDTDSDQAVSAAVRPDLIRPLPTWLFLAVFALIGLNLRAVFGAIPPLLDQIRGDVALNRTGEGLLTALPVLCMGLLAPPSQRLAVRIGLERATSACLALLAASELMRLGATSATVLFGSTIVGGVGMGGVSTLMPALISRYASNQSGLAAGIYSTAMAVGSALAAWMIVPFASLVGGWRQALAAMGLLAALTTLCWAALTPWLIRGRAVIDPVVIGVGKRLPWRNPTALWITLFTTLQTLIGFSGMAWIAPAFQEWGRSARDSGGLLALFGIVQTVSMLALPTLTDRLDDRRPLLALSAFSTTIGLLGLIPGNPTLAVPAVMAFGFGVGGGFSLALVLLVDYTRTPAGTARLTAMVFLIAYGLAGAGPLVVGYLHDITHSFGAGFATLFALSVVQLCSVLVFRRDRQPADELADDVRAADRDPVAGLG